VSFSLLVARQADRSGKPLVADATLGSGGELWGRMSCRLERLFRMYPRNMLGSGRKVRLWWLLKSK